MIVFRLLDLWQQQQKFNSAMIMMYASLNCIFFYEKKSKRGLFGWTAQRNGIQSWKLAQSFTQKKIHSHERPSEPNLFSFIKSNKTLKTKKKVNERIELNWCKENSFNCHSTLSSIEKSILNFYKINLMPEFTFIYLYLLYFGISFGSVHFS